MAKIFWLASYPKSGNTWMRVLLTNYLRDGAAPADINQLDGGPIASARFWFDEWAGIEASAFDDDIIETLRPAVYRCLLRESNSDVPCYIKVHDAWRCNANGEALFPADVTSGVVYVLRHPLDLAMSCAHHWGVTVERAVDNLCDESFVIARSRDGLADQLRQPLGSWRGHVQSWIEDSHLPVHRVRYEDLSQDPETVLSGVVRFCGLPCDAARVRKAVAFSDFSELRRQEQLHGFRERSPRASAAFFRSGRTGSWREELPVPLADRLLHVLGDSIRHFGYADAS